MSTLTVPRPPAQAVLPLRRPAEAARLKLFLRLLAVTLAAVQAWGGRWSISPDGVSYLDIADAYLRGDWHNAVSTYWSPLYSWLLCAGLAFRPPPFWEFAVVKVVNCGIFLGAAAAFEWFIHEATAPRPGKPGEAAALPRGVLFAFAYGLFLWSSCVLTSPAAVSPDLLVSAFVYLAAAWVLRARRVKPGLAASAVFGLILGAGCLAKAALLPLGLLFLLASLFTVGAVRRAAVHLAVAAGVMVVIVGAWVGAMYEKSGRVTLGDVSRLNYVWLVNGVPDHGWLSRDRRLGQPVHPPRVLPTEPPVYEFKDPIPATFPLWYDPSYWCEGLTWRFDVRGQTSAVARNLYAYYDLFTSDLLPFVAALSLLHVGAWWFSPAPFRAKWAARLRSLAGDYPLLVPSLGACAMYALVVVEPRYLAGFIVLLGVALLRAVRFSPGNDPEMRRWGWAAVVVLVLAPTVWLTGRDAVRAASTDRGSRRVAELLRFCGIPEGTEVGSIGSPFDCGWARLGRFHIGAEVRSDDVSAFWAQDAAGRDRVLDAFRQAGAVAVVARNVPVTECEWVHIPETDYAVRILSVPEGAP